jgi:hypothetical protein
MQTIDSHGSDLRAFDTVAGELSQHCEAQFEAGASLAARDIQRLSALAERLGRDLIAWSGAVRALEVGAVQAIDPRRAGRLLIESVFDEALIPEATRVLASALALAFPAAP